MFNKLPTKLFPIYEWSGWSVPVFLCTVFVAKKDLAAGFRLGSGDSFGSSARFFGHQRVGHAFVSVLVQRTRLQICRKLLSVLRKKKPAYSLGHR